MARRLDRKYEPVFPEPDALLGRGAADSWAPTAKARRSSEARGDCNRHQGQRRNRGGEGAPHVRRPSAEEQIRAGMHRGQSRIFSYLDAFDGDAAPSSGPEGALPAHGREQQRTRGWGAASVPLGLELRWSLLSSERRPEYRVEHAAACGTRSNRARNAAAPTSPGNNGKWSVTRSKTSIQENLTRDRGLGPGRLEMQMSRSTGDIWSTGFSSGEARLPNPALR